MSDIFSIITGLEVSPEEVLKAELFAQQLLEDKFPEIDFRQGTGVRDMVIRPNGMMLALMKKAIDTYFRENSLSHMTNASSEEVVDNVMSNFFIRRHSGDMAIIRTRLYFKFPSDRPQVIQIPTSAYFSTDNEHKFYPKENITVFPPSNAAISGRTYFQFDSAEGLWYCDVNLQSEAPDDSYNITSGDLLYFKVFSPYFITGSIQYLVDQAVPKERNLDIIQRAYTSVSTRNLINHPSIVSRLTDMFNFIKFVHIEGMGTPNMYRDMVEVNDLNNTKRNIHLGGMVDVYMSTKPRKLLKQWVTDEHGDIYIPGAVYLLERSKITGSIDGDPDLIPVAQPFTVTALGQTNYTNGMPDNPSQDIGLSADQMLKISFGIAFPLKTASFTTKELPNLNDVQKFLDDKDDRVVSASYLARAYEPHAIEFNIQLHAETEVSHIDIETKLRTYVDDSANGGTLYISDIYGILDDLKVYGVKSPLTLKVKHTDRGRNVTEYVISDMKSLPITQKFIVDSFKIGVGE